MARLGRIIAGVAVLSAAAWGMLWMLAKGDFDAAVDRTLGGLQAAGVEVEIDRRSVAGFPLSYWAELDGVALSYPPSGTTARLPWLESGISVLEPGAVVTRLPERFDLELPVGPGLAAMLPGLGQRVALNVRSEGLRVVAASGEDRAGQLDIRAERLKLSPATPSASTDFSIDIAGFEARLYPATPDRPARLSAVMADAGLTLRKIEGGAARRLELSLGGPTLEALSTAGSQAALLRILAGSAEGRAQATLSLDRLGASLAVTGAGASEDGTLTIGTDALTADSAFEAGAMRVGATVAGLGASLRPADRSRFERGGLGARSIELRLEAPAGPSEEMGRLLVDAALDGVTPDAALWSVLDADAALPREPLAARLALTGSARFTADPRATPPGAAPPLELGNVSLEALTLSGLGAEARARGDVEFVQPVQQPHGLIAVELTGALQLIRALNAAGLIDEQTVQTLATAAAFYTRAGDGPDELRVDLGFDGRGITVNGERLVPAR